MREEVLNFFLHFLMIVVLFFVITKLKNVIIYDTKKKMQAKKRAGFLARSLHGFFTHLER